jgi:hypothetical protein
MPISGARFIASSGFQSRPEPRNVLRRLWTVTKRSGVLALLALLSVGLVTFRLPARAVGSATIRRPKPAVLVTPSAGLHDGERVTVRVSGFPSGEKIFLSECARGSEASGVGCGTELAAQTFGFTSSAGRATVTFTVMSHAAIGPLTRAGRPPRQPCVDCVLVATDGVEPDHPHLNQFAVAALSFRPATLPFTGLPIETLAFLGVATLGIGIFLTGTARRH